MFSLPGGLKLKFLFYYIYVNSILQKYNPSYPKKKLDDQACSSRKYLNSLRQFQGLKLTKYKKDESGKKSSSFEYYWCCANIRFIYLYLSINVPFSRALVRICEINSSYSYTGNKEVFIRIKLKYI